MGVERKFVKSGIDRASIAEFFSKQLERAGYGGMNINRTPMGTQVTIYAERPGLIIGKGGKTIHRLTRELETRFHVDNPQIDVQEVEVPELNAQMMASRLASAIERGLYFRKAGHNMLRRIMDAGALGCEIDISGKLTGPRNRTEKFVAGNMLHAGDPADKLVENGFAIAIKKLGVIGCRVRIIPPTAKLPGRFKVIKEETEEKVEKETEEQKKEGIEELVEGEEEKAEKEASKSENSSEEKAKVEVEKTESETEEKTESQVEERMRNNILEHKHPDYNYWHPASRVHKKEES